MELIKKYAKNTLVNMLLIFGVIGFFVATPIAIYYVYHTIVLQVNTDNKKNEVDSRAFLENYKSYPWAAKHFQEYKAMGTEYRDYIIWRRNSFDGETVKVNSEGIRNTTVKEDLLAEKGNYLFFGGSTMWGSGVSDEFTIPSMFSKEYKVNSVNYGETAYVARQSMAMLVNQYAIGGINKSDVNTIVFYDGLNDVYSRCQSQLFGVATMYEKNLRSTMRESSFGTSYLTWMHIINPAIEFIDKVKKKIAPLAKQYEDHFDCASNDEKAKKVAMQLIDVWRMSSSIASLYGDNFIAILQPVVHIGSPNISHLSELQSGQNLNIKKQYEAVYPYIKKFASAINNKDFKFLDFSHVYNSDEQVYVDFSHVSPQGSELIINEIDKFKKEFNLQ